MTTYVSGFMVMYENGHYIIGTIAIRGDRVDDNLKQAMRDTLFKHYGMNINVKIAEPKSIYELQELAEKARIAGW